MITRLTTVPELKQLFAEIVLNHTSKVSKISDESILNGIAFGVAKVGQKAIKDIALVESHLFPEFAFAQHLDIIAERLGIAPRFTASQSSTFVRLVGEPGTIYSQGVHTFTGNHGIVFDLEEDITIPLSAFAFAKIRSINTGKQSNVGPLTINSVSPEPTGHLYVINDYIATGGRDIEQDDIFKKRIMEGPNLLSKDTLAYINQIFIRINNNVLRTFYQGSDEFGKSVLRIVSQNGVNFNSTELDEFLDEGERFFTLTEHRPYAENYIGLKVENIEWFPIDITVFADLSSGFNPDDVRRDMQINVSKYLDFRFWTADIKVEWDEIFRIIKTTAGVKYVSDQDFSPRVDLIVPKNQLPRIRSFVLRDLEGTLISDVSGNLNPVFFPNNRNESFIQTVVGSA